MTILSDYHGRKSAIELNLAKGGGFILRIRDENSGEAFVQLCGALGDRVSFGIVKSTIKEAKSAFEISRENNSPISSVYKKIRKLKGLDIIRVQTVATDAQTGKKIAYYRCNIKSIEMSMDGYGAKVQLKANEEKRSS